MLRRAVTVVWIVALLGGLSTNVGGEPRGPSPTWTHRAGTGEVHLAIDASGNVYAASARYRGSGADRVHEVWLAKLDPSGALVWSRTWHPRVGRGARAEGVAVSPDGSVYLTGTIEGDGECTAWFVRAYRSDGGPRWHREQPGSGTCRTFSHGGGVAATDSLVAVATGDWSDGWGTTDGYVRAYTPAGNLRWVRHVSVGGFGYDPYTNVGGIAIGAGNRIYTVGAVARRGTAIPDQEAMVQALSPAGTVLWTQVFRDGVERDWEGLGSASVRGRTLAIGGWIAHAGRQARGWIARLRLDGSTLWSRFIGGPPYATEVAVTPSGGIVSARIDRHVVPRTIAVEAFGPGGELVWFTRLDGKEGAFDPTSIAATRAGVAIAGVHQAAWATNRFGRVWWIGHAP